MTLEDILSLANSTQKIIGLKHMGLGGYKGMRYFFDYDFVIEVISNTVHSQNTFKKSFTINRNYLKILRNKEIVFSFTGDIKDHHIKIIMQILRI